MLIKQISEQEWIRAIEQDKTLHADVADGAFKIKIETDNPFICTAIHDGLRLRDEIAGNCALSDAERFYEEDPYTGKFIADMPITVIGRDSRYEYDLNRPPQTAIYEEAWGKVVWKTPLTDDQKAESLEKHNTFYRVMRALYRRVLKKHDACLIYDIHSYNYKRMESPDVPAFNIGTEQLDTEKYGDIINHWNETLNAISLEGETIRSALNEVFYGRGYQATIAKEFNNTLVLPTEFKKIFMDELTGEINTDVVARLKPEFENTILENVKRFSKLFLNK